MQQIVRDSCKLFRQATRESTIGCGSNLSASCPDVAASLWLAVAAAAYLPQPRLRQGMGSARDDGGKPSKQTRPVADRLNVLWGLVFLAVSSPKAVQRPGGLRQRWLCVWGCEANLGLGGDPRGVSPLQMMLCSLKAVTRRGQMRVLPYL